MGGPIATYILSHSHWLGYAGWRWIFFVEGAITIVAGIITFFIMVDRPRDATFLSEIEKQWLDERLKAELAAKSKVMASIEVGSPEEWMDLVLYPLLLRQHHRSYFVLLLDAADP